MTVYVQAAWEKHSEGTDVPAPLLALMQTDRWKKGKSVSALIPQVCSRVSSCLARSSWTERMRGDCGQIDTREVTQPNQVSPGHFGAPGVVLGPCPAHTSLGSHTRRLQEGREGGCENPVSKDGLLGAWLSPQPAQTLAWTI